MPRITPHALLHFNFVCQRRHVRRSLHHCLFEKRGSPARSIRRKKAGDVPVSPSGNESLGNLTGFDKVFWQTPVVSRFVLGGRYVEWSQAQHLKG